jgi:flagellar hook-length control protein FliK
MNKKESDMQQLISYASSVKVENKAGNDSSLLKMIDAAGKKKAKDTHARENTENSSNNVPFMQLLTQQLKSFFQSDKNSLSGESNKTDLKEVQKDLAKLAQMNATQNSPNKTTEELFQKINALLNGSNENITDEKLNDTLSALIGKSGSEENISDLEKILAGLNLKPDQSDKTAAKTNDLLQQLANPENQSTMESDKISKSNIAAALTVGENGNQLKEFTAGDKFKNSGDEFNNSLLNSENNKDAINISKTESIQNLLNEIADNFNLTLKEKINTPEKNIGEISTISVGTANGNNKSDITNNISPDDIVSQVAKEINDNLANNGGRIKITLNPPSLGAVDMDVSIRNNRVQIILVAESKDVQQTLNNHIDQLRGSLQTQGLTIERCDVLMQNKHDEFYRSFNNQSYYQGRSRQENNGRNQDEDGNKAFTGRSVKINQQSVSRISSDTISLFA